MSKEEEKGMDLFDQNLWMASKEAESQDRWIVTTQMRTKKGQRIEYVYTGTEKEAQRMALHYRGTYRRINDGKTEE